MELMRIFSMLLNLINMYAMYIVFLKNIPKELRQLYIMMKEQIKVIKSIDLGHVQTMDLPMSIINGI